jgi:hypothetical protein
MEETLSPHQYGGGHLLDDPRLLYFQSTAAPCVTITGRRFAAIGASAGVAAPEWSSALGIGYNNNIL